MSTKTVYISIGNSDDKLTQREWADFVLETDILLRPRNGKQDPEFDAYYPVIARHGSWRSQPDDPWQNACWCVEIDEELESHQFVWDSLSQLAKSYRQDSIAWAEASTEFITPPPAPPCPDCGEVGLPHNIHCPSLRRAINTKAAEAGQS